MSAKDRDRWDARYRDRSGPETSPKPDAFLVEVAELLPRGGRVLDVAGGDGRNGVWLARQGWSVTLADVSTQAIRLAEANAEVSGVSIATIEADLECHRFPAGPWDLIVCIAYLHRPLFKSFADQIHPEGRLIVVHPTMRNLERFARPSAHHLLGDGELPSLLDGWTILRYEEGWRPDSLGRHDARCLARKSASSL